MSSDFERRLRAVERKLNATQPPQHPPFRIMLIEGGLPGSVTLARAGAHTWRREDSEELEQFVERAAVAAKNLAEPALVVGGLPRGLAELGFETFEEWWATIAPNYPDVPDPEPSWRAPARPRLGD